VCGLYATTLNHPPISPRPRVYFSLATSHDAGDYGSLATAALSCRENKQPTRKQGNRIMMNWEAARRRRVWFSTAASALVLSAAMPAAAQGVTDDQDSLEEIEVEEMVVTGSRIRRTGFEDLPQPAIIVGQEVLQERGFTNIADALNQVPGFGAGIDGVTTGSGLNIGQEFVDLFDLGTQRTLVVVNGRRFVPGNPLNGDPIGRLEGSQVDLNNFAPAMVERIEVLSIGGAPIYGADAIAGTVNIILRDDFEGVDAQFQYGNRVNPGGIPNYTVTGVFGANTPDGRGNVTASIQFEDQAGAVANEFDFFSNQATSFAAGGDPQIVGDEGRFNILEGPIGYLPAPGPGVPLPTIEANVFQDADGNILTFAGDGGLSIADPGVQLPGASSLFFVEGGSLFDTNDFNELIVPVQRFVFTSQAHYDITDYVRVFAETNFLNSNSADLVSQSSEAFNTAFLGTQGQGSFGVSVDNPFLSPQDRQTLIDAGAEETFFLNGINLALLPDAGSQFQELTTFRTVGGLQGDFEFAGRNFNWELSMNFGRTNSTRTEAFILAENFFNAVDSVALTPELIGQIQANEENIALAQGGSTNINVIRDGEVALATPGSLFAGDIVCDVYLDDTIGAVDFQPDNPTGTTGIPPSNVASPDPSINGCTPVNLFAGFGVAPEAVDFISGLGTGFGQINQADLLAFISGELFELPAGWISFVAGVERRREFGSFTPDGVLEDGLSRAPAVPAVPEVEIVSNEYYGEMTIPVLNSDFNLGINDLVGFELVSVLEFSGAYRRINTSIGNDVNVFTAGGTFGLLDGDVTLRGNFTRSVRQPSLVELFAPPALAFDQTGDPCDAGNINLAPTTNRIANCVAAAQALGFDQAAFGTDASGTMGLLLAPGDAAFITPSVNAAIPIGSAGNPDLGFETSNSFTAGIIWQPSFVPGLTIAADYLSINLEDVIVEPDFSFFTQDCLDNSNFSAGEFQPSCGNFERVGVVPDPADGSVIGGFDIVSGNSAFVNSDVLEFQALSANVRYSFEVRDFFDLVTLTNFGPGDLGSVDLRGTFFGVFVSRNSANNSTIQPNGELANVAGTTGEPDFTFLLDMNYNYGPFGLSWRLDYSDNVAPCIFRIPGNCDDIPDAARVLPRDVEHDASISYEVSENILIRGGATDILGNRPNVLEQAFGGFGNAIGRTFFVQLNVRL